MLRMRPIISATLLRCRFSTHAAFSATCNIHCIVLPLHHSQYSVAVKILMSKSLRHLNIIMPAWWWLAHIRSEEQMLLQKLNQARLKIRMVSYLCADHCNNQPCPSAGLPAMANAFSMTLCSCIFQRVTGICVNSRVHIQWVGTVHAHGWKLM